MSNAGYRTFDPFWHIGSTCLDLEFDGDDAAEDSYDICQRILAGKGCHMHPNAWGKHDLLSTQPFDWRYAKRQREERARAEQEVVAEKESRKRVRARAFRDTLTPEEQLAMDVWNEQVAAITKRVAEEERRDDYTEALSREPIPYTYSYRYGDATQFNPNPLQFDAHMGLCPRDPAYPPPEKKPLWTPIAKKPLWNHE